MPRLALILAMGLVLATACLNPSGRRPGLRLTGTVVEGPVSDWSFSKDYSEIQIEARTWYGIRHSVTTGCVSTGDALYVPSLNPDEKRWPKLVARDPRVRVKIGGQVFERRAIRVTDESELKAAIQAIRAKRAPPPGAEKRSIAVFRMDPLER